MKILNIHGYQGSAHNSAYDALMENGYDVISPQIDYDSISPNRTLETVRKIAEEEQIDLIVGTSFGGFFASVLASEKKLPVVLVNPCLLPFFSMPEFGYKGDIREFQPMFETLMNLNIDTASCIIGEQDEVLNTHYFTRKLLENKRFRVVPDGKHSGATLPLKEYFGEVLKDF